MRILGISSAVIVCFVAIACAKQADPPPATPTPGAQGQYPGYPAQPQPYPAQQGYPAQPGYPAQQPYPAQQAYPQPGAAPQPAAPGVSPAPSGQMATPGPLALPCQNDQGCGLAHCNVQFSKCAFPCQTPADCVTGATCNTMTGFCLPGG